jgi:Flp pilus assembly protein TadD
LSIWKAVELEPQNSEALYGLVRALGPLDEAAARQYRVRFDALKEGQQKTGQAETVSNFALVAARAADWSKTIEQLRKAIEICGNCRSTGDLHKNLGLIYGQSGNLKDAELELRLAQKLKPNDPDVLRGLQIIEGSRAPGHP